MLKTTLISLCGLVLAVGCGSKGGDAAQCSAAATKGVDSMMKARDTSNAPPEMQQKITEMGGKLKDAISKRCAEDKWPKEVIDCVSSATTQPELKACREKLPKEAADKLRADEMAVMSSMMGAMGGMRHGMHGGGGMGGPGSDSTGSAMAAPAPTGSAVAPAPAPAPAGSAK
ncbi:MAG TPA: hypothetical protein VGG28_01830 [Kofleriaceae bacterium]|jgi:small lipoprotein (TIGR04454 family)